MQLSARQSVRSSASCKGSPSERRHRPSARGHSPSFSRRDRVTPIDVSTRPWPTAIRGHDHDCQPACHPSRLPDPAEAVDKRTECRAYQTAATCQDGRTSSCLVSSWSKAPLTSGLDVAYDSSELRDYAADDRAPHDLNCRYTYAVLRDSCVRSRVLPWTSPARRASPTESACSPRPGIDAWLWPPPRLSPWRASTPTSSP